LTIATGPAKAHPVRPLDACSRREHRYQIADRPSDYGREAARSTCGTGTRQ